MTVSVVVPFGVPPDGAGVLWLPPQPARIRKPAIAAAIVSRTADRRTRARRNSKRNASSKETTRHITRGILGVDDGGATTDGLVVATAAVAVIGVEPSVRVTEAGAMVQVAPEGAPVQARATF